MKNDNNECIEDELISEEMLEFEEKFCHGIMKARVLTEKEVEELKKQGRI